jgi:hypothetical protein
LHGRLRLGECFFVTPFARSATATSGFSGSVFFSPTRGLSFSPRRKRGLATILNSVAARNPKAKSMKPEDFVDMAIVQELDKGGFIANATK